MTYVSKRLSIWTKCWPTATRMGLPLSFSIAFQLTQRVMWLLFALTMRLRSSFVIFCCVNGIYLASLLIKKLLARAIRKILVSKTSIDSTQYEDKFLFSRSQKLSSLRVSFLRLSNIQRISSDSFGDRLCRCSEFLMEVFCKLFMTANKNRNYYSIMKP